MFGLMTPPTKCSSACDHLYQNHRMHYCGTCKTIGQEYGQSARMMLNFDAVFLAELLSLLSNDDTSSWQKALQQVNACLTLPKKDSEDSLALKYAATSNVLLGELNIKDHIVDNGKRKWKFLSSYFSSTFNKAQQQLQEWEIDTTAIQSLAKAQEQLEKEKTCPATNIDDFLSFYAAPTAEITARIFEGGAKVIQQEKLAQDLYKLGYNYGQLAYILDAFIDVEVDIYNKEFNPLALFNNADTTLSEDLLEEVRNIILTLQNKVITQLQNLPIELEQQTNFAARLSSNIALEIYQDRHVPTSTWDSIILRWQHAKEKANALFCEENKGWLQLRYYLVAVAVFISPDATHQIMPVDSKAMVFSWMAAITALMGSIGLGVIYKNPVEKDKRQKRREERKKKRAERKRLKKESKFFKSPKASKYNCIGDCFEAFFEIIFLIFYFAAAAFVGVGAIVGTIGFLLSLTWGGIVLMVAFSLALLVIGFGLFADFFHNMFSTEGAVFIAFVLAIIIALAAIAVIIFGSIALAAFFNPFTLALVIIAAVVFLILLLMFIFSDNFSNVI